MSLRRLVVATLVGTLGSLAASAVPLGAQTPASATTSPDSAHVTQQRPADDSSAQRDTGQHAPLALATFDTAWQLIYERHFDTTFNGVDWMAVRAELRPRAAAARTTEELRAVIRDMLGRLHESHFALIPREAADEMAPAARAADSSHPSRDRAHDDASRATISSDAAGGDSASRTGTSGANATAAASGSGERDGDVGMELRLLGDRLRVWRVAPGSAAAAAGVRSGWELRAVDGQDVRARVTAARTSLPPREAALEATLATQQDLSGAPGSHVVLQFADARGHKRTVTLARTRTPGTIVKFGNLPPLPVHLERERRTTDGTTVGIIRFNIWMPVILPPFDSAMDAMRGADGIIIDLRGNLGGLGAMVMGTSGHFLRTRVSLGSMKMRNGELHFFANPRLVSTTGTRVEPYDGPVAILVDGLTASTSEVFAGGMQSVGRARIFGDTTAGAVLPALNQRLPNGDVLYHAVAEFITPDGVRLEGRGVIPDQIVPLSVADLAAGRDAVLDAAIRWIAAERASHHEESAPHP
ncbi:MAG TPA: S41 family peptidase [Gemmatimonadaceae bacterium]|nr:S41 family peptidase [Gemmatimonadaceae bacterium]